MLNIRSAPYSPQRWDTREWRSCRRPRWRPPCRGWSSCPHQSIILLCLKTRDEQIFFPDIYIFRHKGHILITKKGIRNIAHCQLKYCICYNAVGLSHAEFFHTKIYTFLINQYHRLVTVLLLRWRWILPTGNWRPALADLQEIKKKSESFRDEEDPVLT